MGMHGRKHAHSHAQCAAKINLQAVIVQLIGLSGSGLRSRNCMAH